MSLLAIYVVIVVAVELMAVELGLFLDTLAPTFAVPMGLGLFFAVLVLGWPLAIYITERWLPEKHD